MILRLLLWVGVLMDKIRRQFDIDLPALILAAGIDNARQPELLAQITDTIDQAGNAFAKTAEYDVVFDVDDGIGE